MSWSVIIILAAALIIWSAFWKYMYPSISAIGVAIVTAIVGAGLFGLGMYIVDRLLAPALGLM